MSFKDDFLEALRSVKRDFIREPEQTEPPSASQPMEAASKEELAAPASVEPRVSDVAEPTSEVEFPVHPFPVAESEQDDTQSSNDEIYQAFQQASAIGEGGFQEPEDGFFDRVADGNESLDDSEDGIIGDTTPFREFDPTAVANDLAASFHGGNGGRYTTDFDDGDAFGGDKTIISKNTVINGSLSTDDNLRLLGQVMGDIDCRSNIVVAGKVRGNTTAANAYIFDAQIDGDLRCDDAVNVSNDAWILGNIRAQQAEIDGKIKGNIEIRHMVSIGSSSSVLGDISADELEVKRGAFVNGQVMMYSPSRDVLDRFDNFED